MNNVVKKIDYKFKDKAVDSISYIKLLYSRSILFIAISFL